MKKSLLLSSLITLPLMLAGCVTREQPPNFIINLPQSWSLQTTNFATKHSHLANWWQSYNSQTLNTLVETALKNNPSLEEAGERIISARALARVQGAQNKPSFDSNSKTGVENRLSGNPLGLNVGGEALGEDSLRTVGSFQSSLDAKWEIDLFGRLKNASEASKKVVDVAENDREDVKVILIAEIVKTYSEYHSAISKTRIINNEINARKSLVQLIEKQKKAGAVGEFDVQRVISSYEISRSKLPNYELARVVAEKRLQTLTNAQSISSLLKNGYAKGLAAPSMGKQLAIDIIRARPDVRKAESVVLQRGFEAEVAHADLYPKLSLIGVLDFKTSLIGKPVLGSPLTLGGSPLLTIPLFDWGIRKSVLASKEALWRESVAAYRGVIFKAIEDVEIARASINASRVRLERQTVAFNASQKAHSIADKLYQGGSVGLTERLQAETEMRQTELELAEARELARLAPIMLYKAIAAGSYAYKPIIAQATRENAPE